MQSQESETVRALRARLAELEQTLADSENTTAKLRAENKYYRSLFDISLAGIFITMPDGTVLNANPEACRLVGRTEQEICQLGRNGIVNLQDPRLRAALETRERTGEFRGELSFVHADGTIFPVQMLSRIVPDADGSARANIFFYDITEAKRAENALREREEHLRAIYESTSVAIGVIDVHGKWIGGNHAFHKLVGYTQSELEHLTVRDTTHPDDLESTLECIRAVLEGGTDSFRIEKRYLTKQGETIWVDVSAAPMHNAANEIVALVGAIIDIGERKRAYDKLKQSEAFAESVISALSEGLVVQDTQDKILIANQSAADILGLTMDQLLGKDSYDPRWQAFREDGTPFRPEEHPSVVTMRTGKGVDNVVMNVHSGEGKRSVISINSRPVRGENGSMTSVVTTFFDISERMRAEDALRASETKYHRLVENSPDVVYIFSDKRGGIYYSPRVEQVLGYTREYIYAHPFVWSQATHPDDMHIVEQAIALSAQGQGFDVEYRSRDAHGNWHWIHDRSIDRFTENGETFVEGIASDITERKQREREMQAVAVMSAALRQAHNRAEMLPIIVNEVTNLVHAAAIELMLEEEASGDFVMEYVHGEWADDRGMRLPRTAGIPHQVLKHGSAYLTNDLPNDPNFLHKESIRGMTAFVQVPLATRDKIIGFLGVAARHSFNEADVRVLSAISDIAASAIQRTTLFERAAKYAADLERAYDSTLEGWAHALELRDQETEGHSRRVVERVLELAQLFGVNDADLEHIRRGALLHDIGKMGIPDSVLLKHGTLNEREWEIMRRHPEYAYRLLYPIEFLRPALDIPYCHHEKWDGSGYPRGLKGNAIPLAARIFAVVDVWDALTSNRTYRAAWSEARARAYLETEAGKHFDAQVVQVFLARIAESER